MTRSLIAALALAGLAAVPAWADQQCAARDKLAKMLDRDFGERLESGGLTGNTKLVEIWASDETGTWTILVTEPGGQSCILASGKDWLDFPASATTALNDLKG